MKTAKPDEAQQNNKSCLQYRKIRQPSKKIMPHATKSRQRIFGRTERLLSTLHSSRGQQGTRRGDDNLNADSEGHQTDSIVQSRTSAGGDQVGPGTTVPSDPLFGQP